MKTNFVILLAFPFLLSYTEPSNEKVLTLKAHLSAFGVESDYYPTIDAIVDFNKDTGSGKRLYYDPRFKPSKYTIPKHEIVKLEQALNKFDLAKLKRKYSIGNRSDQPTSTITITTNYKTYSIEDYGLAADEPLRQLYNTVYKFEY